MLVLRDKRVTSSFLNTLASRPDPLFRASGRKVVVCRHYRVKRESVQVEVDRVNASRVHCCPCCENLYVWVDDTPGPCPDCNPNRPRGRY